MWLNVRAQTFFPFAVSERRSYIKRRYSLDATLASVPWSSKQRRSLTSLAQAEEDFGITKLARILRVLW